MRSVLIATVSALLTGYLVWSLNPLEAENELLRKELEIEKDLAAQYEYNFKLCKFLLNN